MNNFDLRLPISTKLTDFHNIMAYPDTHRHK
jgi:hypothetical protein